MSSRSAPRAATWLLERVGGRSRFEPLIGDLVEQFEHGRSRLWYWRQAVGTVAMALAQPLRLPALSFIAALAAGCALIWLVDAGYPYALQPLQENLSALSLHPWTAHAILRTAAIAMCGLLSDALILATVWAVTCIHRSHPRALLSLFAAAVTVRYLPGLARLVIHAATDPRFTASLVSRHLHLMMPVAWQALCILAGGLWVVRRPRFTGTEPRALTCFVAILAALLCVLAGLARAAGLVGELTYTLHQQYLFDVLNIANMACLVLLLWRRNPVIACAGVAQ